MFVYLKPKPMKIICSILILVMALHSQCGVECLNGVLNVIRHSGLVDSEGLACHDAKNPDEAPIGEDSPRHDTSESCGQAQAFERTAPILKYASQWLPVAHSPSTNLLAEPAFASTAVMDPHGAAPFLPSVQISVLRI